MPEIDLAYETKLIRQGLGESLGNNRWKVNDRVYVRKGDDAGTLYPESGSGIVNISRAQFRALIILITYNGYTEQAAKELDKAPDISIEDVKTARDLYAKRTKP